MIVLHRRGTTGEWQQADLLAEQMYADAPDTIPDIILKNGEFAIEEREDGSRYVKIGDGHTSFNALPYIDKRAEVLANDVKASLQENLTKIENKLSNSSFAQANKLSAEIASIKAAHASDINEIEDSLSTINKRIDEHEEVAAEIDKQNNATIANIRKQLDLLNAGIKQLGNTDTELSVKITGLSNTLAGITDQLYNELAILSAKHNADCSANAASVKAEENARLDADSAIVNAMLEYVTKIYAEIADLVDDDILILEKAFAVENNLTARIKTLEEKYTTIIGKMVEERFTALKEELTGIIAETLVEPLAALTETVEELRFDTDVKFAENNEVLTNLETNIDTKINNTVEIVEANKIAISDNANAIIALDDKFTEYRNTFDETFATLKADTEQQFAGQQEVITALEAAIQTDISKKIADVEILIESNKDAIEATGAAVEALEEKLTAPIETLEENLAAFKADVEQHIADSSETFDNISTELQTLESDLETQLETQVTSINTLIESNKNETDASFEEVAASFEEVAAQLATVNSRVDDANAAIELQSERLNNLVSYTPDGSVKDIELVDIRIDHKGQRHNSAGDAVRSIGEGLVDLEESLSQYIGTQAVTGLHYDINGEVGLQQPYMLYLKAGNDIIQTSGVQVIGGSGGGGGTGSSSLSIKYITESPLVVTPADKAILYFTFSGTDSSGDTIKQASATWQINGITVEHGTVKDGINEFDATKYVSTGTTTIFLTVTDANRSIVTKEWSIRQIELTIASTFNDRRKYPAGEPIIFDYIPTGAVEKTVIFKLDGQEIDRVTLGKEVSGSSVSYELPAQTHGAHLLDVHIEAVINDETIPSNHILKDILWFDNSSSAPVISTTPHNLTVKQYSTTNIVYTVYDPLNENPSVVIKVDDDVVATPVVTPNKDYDNTTTAIYSYSTASVGAHIIKLICGDTEKIINVFVEDIGVNISPVTAGLAFDFNPAGISNSDENRVWSYNDVHMTVSPNFDWINGGYIPDDPDGPCFCIKAGSWAEIDYQLFANEAKVYGKEFKLIFKTKNVSNPDAIFLSCIDNTTAKDHIGITMGVHSAHIYGKSGNLELAYSEEDAIEFEFNISKDTEAVPMVMGYEDGVPSRPMVYDSTFSFKQDTPKIITLGSPDCDLYIYRFKVYNASLSNTDILKNFIADSRTAEDMIARYNRNQIYDENQMLTAESIAASCPWLRVYKISAPHFTNNKSDKVSDTTIQQIYKGGDPVLDNWVAYNSQHSGQGTSSNNYGAAGRNLDFIMNKSSSYFELGDGSTTDKITLTRESVPVAYLNAKVNIASSNNLTNAILANRYNRFNPYRRPFVREEGVNTDFIKDTMEFHNCVIFIQETDPDLSTHREFADTDWHFYAIGNIGDSKKTDKTRLTDQSDPYECCVEIMDVDLPLSAFPRDTMIDAMSYEVDETTEERVYTWAKDSNLGILYEKQDDGSYVLTSDTTVDYDKTYYVDILLHDDFSEDYTYGWRYISDDENPEVVYFCKQKWIEFYRFVTTSSNEEFKANLKNYFVVDSALYYYLFTTRYCMVDNRAKNTFWHYSKTADGTRKWDLCWDYDNDTSLGLNNYGKQLYRYGLEDVDFDSTGTEVFRQSDSLFFCRIRDLFGSELKKMYQDLESKDAWKASTLIKESDDWQEQFPEELWRVDIERKYIRTYTRSFISGNGDKQFLTNMSNGRMKYHRRNWERNQEAYMASKYQTTAAMSEDAHANFRVRKLASTDGLVIKPNYQFTLTPYSYIYLNVYYNSGSPISVRAEPNVPTLVPYNGTNADIINVGSAAAIKDFGDLSALYPDTVSVQNASRARTLKIGNSTEGYSNVLSSYTDGKNNLLEELDLTNTNYSKTIDLRALINLKKILAFGTNSQGVLFAEGGKMQYAELPALGTLELKNLKYLATENLKLSSYDNVVDLTVVGCSLLNQLSLLEACTNVKRVKLDNINFGTKTYEYFEEKIFKLGGTDTDVANAQITGTVHFESLTGAQFNALKSRYPNLVITYDLLISTVTFKDTDTESTIYERTVLNAGDCEDPSVDDDWTAPVMIASQEFKYEWFGWSESKNILLNYELLDENSAVEAEQADYNKYRVDSLKHIEGDRTLYPVFKVVRQQYEVQFINPTDNNKVLYSIMVPYGFNTVYIGTIPQKLDSVSPENYEFTGWYPRPENIVDTLHCYAQFAVKDQDRLPGGEDDGDTLPGYTIGWLDINYSLNETAKTMNITKCNNNLNTAIRVPETLMLKDTTYTVVSLAGFNGNNNLELIDIPDTVKIFANSVFSNCTNLAEIKLPSELTTIGSLAFEKCYKITDIHIPSKVSNISSRAFAATKLRENGLTVDQKNTKYEVIDDCLLQGKGLSSGKLLLKGLSTGIIPTDGSVSELAEYCFEETDVVTVYIPDSVTKIGQWAFRLCSNLEEVRLPECEEFVEIPPSCFSTCGKLRDVLIPASIKAIRTYAFAGCAFENITIPASVADIDQYAFGNQAYLTTVTFAERRDGQGNIAVPDMDYRAFDGSGSSSGVIFNVPWSMDYDYSAVESVEGWGAKNWTIYYRDGWRKSTGESGTY